MDRTLLRDVCPEDAEAIAALVRSLPEWFTPDVPETATAAALRLPARAAVSEEGALLGLVVWKTEGCEAEIEWIMVARESHRRGLGRRLLADLLARLDRRTVTRLVVNTVAPSVNYEPYARTRAFYEAAGFALEHTEPAGWPDGTDKGRYVLTLTDGGSGP